MKTAMQELIEYIGYKKTNPIVRQLLEEEKKQIMDAYGQGFDDGLSGEKNWAFQGGDDYYNETFKP